MIIQEHAITKAKNKLGLNGLSISFIEGKENVTIVRKFHDVKITYSQIVEAFRALTYVKEHIQETDYEVTLSRHFKSNGLMVDCSRNGVVNLATIKDFVLLLALMGQDRLLLYTEDTYKLDKYPYFGYLRGGYSKEDIKSVVAYAKDFGVKIVPCIQTLGHLERFLHWNEGLQLKDGQSTLLIGEEKVYEFIEEAIKFSRECFDSDEIHIGMDESTEIGLGRYLGIHKKVGNRVELFVQHLAKVIEICKKYKFTPMIWSDMIFRLNSQDEEYYRDSPLPESTIKAIPEGIELVYWDYYHTEKEVYDRMNEYHKSTNREIIFAGGAWRWKGFTPSVRKSLDISQLAIASCVDYNIKNVFVTAWGDNGNECSVYTSIPTLALYSDYDYFGKSSDESISSLVKAITGDSLEMFLDMDLPDMPDNKVLLPHYNPSKYFLYQDPLNGIFDSQVKAGFAANYEKHYEKLLAESSVSRDYGYIYLVLAKLCKVLSTKVDLGVRLRKAYKTNDKKALKAIYKSIPTLINDIDDLKDCFFTQWNNENRSFGFDVIDGRLGYIKNRLITTREYIYKYIKGKIAVIEELETDILPFNGADYEVSWNWWINTVSVNNI